MAQDVVREFVREHRGQLRIVGDIGGDRGGHLDIAAVGSGVEPARRDQLEAARAALLGRDMQASAARRRGGSRSRARPSAKAASSAARICSIGSNVRASARAAARAGLGRRAARRTSSSRSPARSAGPPGDEREHAGPGVRGRRPESPPADRRRHIARGRAARSREATAASAQRSRLGDREPVADRGDALVERAHGEQRLLGGACPAAAPLRAGADSSRGSQKADEKSATHQDLLILPGGGGPRGNRAGNRRRAMKSKSARRHLQIAAGATICAK